MKRAMWFTIAGLAIMLMVGAAPAFAQIMAAKVDITFPFVVHGKTLPAGPYEIEKQSSEILTIRSVTAPKNEAQVMALSRLAERAALANPELVFDKVGTRSYLSEVWLPGDDGYLVYAAKEAHTHARINAVKK